MSITFTKIWIKFWLILLLLYEELYCDSTSNTPVELFLGRKLLTPFESMAFSGNQLNALHRTKPRGCAARRFSQFHATVHISIQRAPKFGHPSALQYIERGAGAAVDQFQWWPIHAATPTEIADEAEAGNSWCISVTYAQKEGSRAWNPVCQYYEGGVTTSAQCFSTIPACRSRCYPCGKPF